MEAFLAEQFAELDACRDRLGLDEVDDEDRICEAGLPNDIPYEMDEALWVERTRKLFPEGMSDLTEEEVLYAVAEATFKSILEYGSTGKRVRLFSNPT